MIKTACKTGITLLALALLSACATQDEPKQLSNEAQKCPPNETLTCDRFANENYNCTCQKGDRLRDMIDAYGMPDY